MSQLEVKEKELNKLKQESDQLVLNQHPASDKIEVGFMRFIFLSGEERGHFSKNKTIQETKKTIQICMVLFYYPATDSSSLVGIPVTPEIG